MLKRTVMIATIICWSHAHHALHLHAILPHHVIVWIAVAIDVDRAYDVLDRGIGR